MKITLLGTSAAIPLQNRSNTMLCVCENERNYLIDCSGDAAFKLIQAGIDLSTIEVLFFTHRHVDHILGFPHLIQIFLLQNRILPLLVFAPEDVITILKKSLELYKLYKAKLTFNIDYYPVSSRKQEQGFMNAIIRVTSFPVKHGLSAVGYSFESFVKPSNFVYSGDTAYSKKLVNFAHDTSLLIHEATLLLNKDTDEAAIHSTIMDAAQVAYESNAKKLALVHFGTDPELFEDKIIKNCKKLFDREVIIGKDLMKLYL